jgi:nucleoid-associated protein YgaU
MSLTEKYGEALKLAEQLKVKNFGAKEDGGKLKITGTTEYSIDRDHIWDKLKKASGWQAEIQADLKVERSDVYGYWEVKSGDSLSKIAKDVYDDGNKYMKIFDANKDVLKDPNVIHPGQKLKLPNP